MTDYSQFIISLIQTGQSDSSGLVNISFYHYSSLTLIISKVKIFKLLLHMDLPTCLQWDISAIVDFFGPLGTH